MCRRIFVVVGGAEWLCVAAWQRRECLFVLGQLSHVRVMLHGLPAFPTAMRLPKMPPLPRKPGEPPAKLLGTLAEGALPGRRLGVDAERRRVRRGAGPFPDDAPCDALCTRPLGVYTSIMPLRRDVRCLR